MRWIDVAGPPGSGKSTLCDGRWPPRAIRGDASDYPVEWREFLECVARMLDLVRHHPSYRQCHGMTHRTLGKMAAVRRSARPDVYVQTGLIQRGLGFGWRLDDPELVAEYFEVMPVSLGAAILRAPVDVVVQRNVARGKDRSHMVPLIERPLQIAIEVLTRRSVPLAIIDMTQPVEDSLADLDAFVAGLAGGNHPGRAA